jgi:hypothetical protein
VTTTRIYYDCEFYTHNGHTDLFSIGLVDEDGREMYGILADLDAYTLTSDPWLRKNVWAHLPTTSGGLRLDKSHPDVMPRAELRDKVGQFIRTAKGQPKLWSYYADHDHVCLTGLWGSMTHTPDYLPMRTDDLAQEAERLGNPPLPAHTGTEHHALHDARWHAAIGRAVFGLRGRLHQHGCL